MMQVRVNMKKRRYSDKFIKKREDDLAKEYCHVQSCVDTINDLLVDAEGREVLIKTVAPDIDVFGYIYVVFSDKDEVWDPRLLEDTDPFGAEEMYREDILNQEKKRGEKDE